MNSITEDNVCYDRRIGYCGGYYIKRKLSNGQTMIMQFIKDDGSILYFNICLAVYTKRRQASYNEENAIITGKNPFESFIVARKMFLVLEKYVVNRYRYRDLIIMCRWVDNRRRDAYYKVLSRYGYQYGTLYGHKAIYKKFEKQEGI